MTLNPEDVVEWSIPEEYLQLRGPAQSVESLTLLPNTIRPLREFSGDSFELELQAATLSGKLELRLLESPDGCEFAAVRIDPETRTVAIDSSRIGNRACVSNRHPVCYSGFGPDDFPLQEVSEQKTSFALPQGESLHLQVFVDRSIIEVFVNHRLAMSQLVYPSGTANRQLSLLSSADQNVENLTMIRLSNRDLVRPESSRATPTVPTGTEARTSIPASRHCSGLRKPSRIFQ